MAIDAVLLDIDGTLVDSNEFHVIAWQRAFQEANTPIAPELIHKQLGKGADMLTPALAPHLPQKARDAIAKRHGEIFKEEFLPRVEAFPNARDLIAALHRSGREVVLASSCDQAEVDHYVHLLRVKELLRATTSADDVEKSKPAGDIFASALQKTSSRAPDRAIAIGDTPYDAIAAAKCGIRTIAVRSGGFTDEELLSGHPIAIYEDVGDLFECLPESELSDER
jgi:HAD superfamily hydrolase (TIGR01509 family)